MVLKNLVNLIGGTLLFESDEINKREYRYAFASDLMSNVMLHNVDDSILITALVNPQTIRASEMMNISCIIVTEGKPVTEAMVEMAEYRSIALVTTEMSTFSVCGILHINGITEGPVTDEDAKIRSMTLNMDKCIGCINCVRKCPTEAIRMKAGKASVDPERCIECGMCVKVCKTHAIRPFSDSLDTMSQYEYKIAIPSSAFYGQFAGVKSRNHLLTALKQTGFDMVYEEACAYEFIAHHLKKDIRDEKRTKPVISTGCPAVIKLIQMKFPGLIPNISEYKSPIEIAGDVAREQAEREHPGKKIGVFFIAPCNSEVSYLLEKDTSIDHMIAISAIYRQVRSNLKELKDEDVEDLQISGLAGIRNANPGGEALALGTDRFIAVDGIDEVIDILEQVECERIEDIEYIEAKACSGGCFGGTLTVENIYSARANLKVLVDEAKDKLGYDNVNIIEDVDLLKRKNTLEFRPVLQLDRNLNVALKKMEEMGKIISGLPGVDCGICGAPTCKAFAEDVVRGIASENACILTRR